MRKVIIFVALFMLLSVPAFAADNDTVDANIIVSGVWYIDAETDNKITFTIDNGEYAAGEVKPDSDEAVTMTVKSNKDYNLRVNRDTPTGWPTTWNLYTNIGATCASDQSDYLVTTAGVVDYWATDQGPSNSDPWDFYFIIDPIAYVDDWVGNHNMTITVTLQ